MWALGDGRPRDFRISDRKVLGAAAAGAAPVLGEIADQILIYVDRLLKDLVTVTSVFRAGSLLPDERIAGSE
jgi:hypothetical protein